MLEIHDIINNRIALVSPYEKGMVTWARNMGGQFVEIAGIGKAWVFPADLRAPLSAAVKAVFGVPLAELTAPRHVSVTVRVKADLGVAQGACIVAGYVLASAIGRDSGARVGNGVAMLSGEIGGGGSMKNWYTEVKKGTVMMLRNFPVAWIEQLQNSSSVEVVEIMEAATVLKPATTPEEAAQLALQAIRTAGLDADLAALLAAIRAA